jgi:hypothetical protein
MWYGGEGVSITEYDDRGDDVADPVVVEEWWFTWPELFTLITDVDDYRPEIYSQR